MPDPANRANRTECTIHTTERITKTTRSTLLVVDFGEVTHRRAHLLADVGLFEKGSSFSGNSQNWSELVSYMMDSLTAVIGLSRNNASISEASEHVIEIELPADHDAKRAKLLIDKAIGRQSIKVQTFS